MAKFPDPIPLPNCVQEARKARERELIFSCIIGIAIRVLVIVAELVGVSLFGSSVLMLDALASLFDVASSIFLVICMKLAAKPPDKDHPLGHGRYEPLVGLQLGIFLVLVGGGMFVQQLMQTASASELEPLDHRAWLIPALAVILLEICYHVVKRAAKKQHSPALEADAAHYRTDSITSLFALAALLLAAYQPQWSRVFDHLGAAFIAAVMIGLGVMAGRKNLHQLTDRIPAETFFTKVREAAQRASGVLGTEKVLIQVYGPDAHVSIDIEVDPELSVEKAHTISQMARAEIQKAWPAVRDVAVHIEPFYPDDH